MKARLQLFLDGKEKRINSHLEISRLIEIGDEISG